MSAHDSYDHAEADRRLAEDFGDLSRDKQAVLSYATILGLRSQSDGVKISAVAAGLGMDLGAVEDVIEALYDRGLAWRAGESLLQLDHVQTSLCNALTSLAVGAGGRPNSRDWRGLRELVFRQVFPNSAPRCLYCKIEYPEDELVLDHALPVSRGGSNHPANLIPSCPTCNGRKGNLTYQEWMAKREGLAAR